MSNFAFEAKCVVTEPADGEFHLVGFADQEFDTRFYLMLQRALEHDEQDRALGMDTYHVEWCDQGMSGYGGISRLLLCPNGVEVSFEPQAGAKLNSMEHLSISFQLSRGEFLRLREALGNIFVGSGCLVVADA